ncbi:MAG: hypothetical protein GXX79_09785 [Actinomycetales bacterium]|nr:hypothetical protein [Actinomycetales bacterium]
MGGGPYGAPPAGPYGPPGYPPSPYPGFSPVDPEIASLRNKTITALVINCVSVFTCCFALGIPGAIVAGIAMSKVNTEPFRARQLLRWAWGLLIANVVVAILVVVAYIALIASSEDWSNY